MSDDVSVLVPVGESVTLRQTVAYVVRSLADDVAEGGRASVHFVYPLSSRPVGEGPTRGKDDAETLLERVRVWTEEDVADEETVVENVAVETAVIGEREYLFSPSDYAESILDYARDHDLDRIVVDPEYAPAGQAPMLRPLVQDLIRSGIPVEEAPVERRRSRVRLLSRGRLSQYLTLFVASFAFYQVLGGFGHLFVNVITGAISAGITALVLGRVSFTQAPNLPRLAAQTLRMGVYAPYLLWEIAKANVAIAYTVLHPSLPIDPKLVEFDAAIGGDLPVTTLANSITLTPGTLTVDVDYEAFYIHSLTQSARDDLFAGGLERAVRFVFYGRDAARIPSPIERGQGRRVAAGAETEADPGSGSETEGVTDE